MFGSWVLNEIWIIDLSSALVGMLMSSSKLFILYYLCEINSSIHIYQFTFELLHFGFRMWLWLRIWTKILADRCIWPKNRYGLADLHTPIHPHLYCYNRQWRWGNGDYHDWKLLSLFQKSSSGTSTRPQKLYLVQRKRLLSSNRTRPYISASSSSPSLGASDKCLQYTNFFIRVSCCVCAADQNLFYNDERLTVCEAFCDKWFAACDGAKLTEFKGMKIKGLFKSGKEFCQARTFSRHEWLWLL